MGPAVTDTGWRTVARDEREMGGVPMVLQPGFTANRMADEENVSEVPAGETAVGLAATVATDNVAGNLQTVVTRLWARQADCRLAIEQEQICDDRLVRYQSSLSGR